MKVVVQRVSKAHVEIEGNIQGSIGNGLLVFLGIHKNDTPKQTEWLVKKLLSLRIFEDHNHKMNLSIKDVKGEILIISQFTLYGNAQNGARPDFLEAAPPAHAIPIYEKFITEIKKEVHNVQTGIFGADMQVFLINDGPVTLVIEGK